ncbi:NUDIX hydrolase [Acinetobacter soli]|jgi:8-oxo-dGTP diphosphatase|uniref:NUDIX hydrolase n=1 Tax=Acinetobacter soli TaxID=487316 RepID=UPI0032B539E9
MGRTCQGSSVSDNLTTKTIRVAAAIIFNDDQQLLLVRKRNTTFFMQVGGKLEANESSEAAIIRETFEETGCHSHIVQSLGRFETQAANEPDHSLIADVYLLQLEGQPQIQAEIAQMKWISVDDQHTPLAPLTREIVLPWCVNYLASRETEAAATQTG